MIICPNCGKENEEGSKFCISCGSDLIQGKEVAKETIPAVKELAPAEQAAQMGERAKKVWKGFSFSEKMITVGALVVLVGFFLPWVSSRGLGISETISGMKIAEDFGWLYLHPLLMLVSLALVYFTQGAPKITKILMARWQIVIGSIFAFKGIFGIIAGSKIISGLEDLAGAFGGFGRGAMGVDINIGIGWWLLTLGAIAILVGAFRIQKELLK